SDCRLQLAYMKLDSLVIVHQPRHGEYVPEPCTRDAARLWKLVRKIGLQQNIVL
ncbi:MAG: hypothetical protein UX31_C0013G0027, partial [Candidatus Nomurabacteria bacterium GW2011_GWA1_46_11]